MPYGISSVTNTAGTVVGTASTTVLAANTSRRYVRITNLTTGRPVFLSLGTAAAVGGAGIGLAGFGSAPCFWEAGRGDSGFWSGAVTAIGDGGTALLSIMQA